MDYKNKEIKLNQDGNNNLEWVTWRESGVGGSEVGIIIGALPVLWGDVLELWKLKTGLKESDFVMNEAMQRGKDLEPIAREKYIKATGIQVRATCFELIKHPFCRASLDGISKDNKQIVEIKVQGLSKWKQAKKGNVAPYYYAQMQYQALCSGAASIHFWTYREDEGGVLINVPRNEEYIEELVRRAAIFWNCVEERTPCLPRMLNIDMSKDSDPFEAGDMKTKFLGVYKN